MSVAAFCRIAVAAVPKARGGLCCRAVCRAAPLAIGCEPAVAAGRCRCLKDAVADADERSSGRAGDQSGADIHSVRLADLKQLQRLARMACPSLRGKLSLLPGQFAWPRASINTVLLHERTLEGDGLNFGWWRTKHNLRSSWQVSIEGRRE